MPVEMLGLQWELGDWRNAAEARDLLGRGARLLARNSGSRFSFAAADLSTGAVTVRRSVVLLREADEAVAFLFDIASAPFTWRFSGASVVEIQAPRTGVDSTSALASTADATRVEGVDLLGARWGDWVVLFHTGLNAAQSSLSFDSTAGLRYLITGLGPGYWDIWRDGWLDEIGLPVRPPAASLRFDSEPGSFFIRKFG